jgi:branched-chain amino acid transport system ATP-binding protein
LVQTNKAVLNVQEISVSYGMVSALKAASLEVNRGEFISLIGANGAGKSTLLETILGFHPMTSGQIYFLGDEITNKSTDRIVASGISLCPEGRGLLPAMSVLENLLLGAYHNRRKIKELLEQVFDLFPILAERKNQPAGTLSGGQQQMVSIGRCLMGSPKLMMLDEPSLGLAPLVIDEILETITNLAKGGLPILLSEQNARKALQYSTRAYVFETGRVALEGSSAELMSNQAVIDAYLGGGDIASTAAQV